MREGRCEVLAPEGLEAGEPQWRGFFEGRSGRRRGRPPQETVRVVVGVLDDLVSLILATAGAVRALVRGQRPNQIEGFALRTQLLLDLFSLFPLLCKIKCRKFRKQLSFQCFVGALCDLARQTRDMSNHNL